MITGVAAEHAAEAIGTAEHVPVSILTSVLWGSMEIAIAAIFSATGGTGKSASTPPSVHHATTSLSDDGAGLARSAQTTRSRGWQTENGAVNGDIASRMSH